MQEMLLELIVDSSTCGYVITDCEKKDNPVIFVNRAFESLTGYSAQDILGKNSGLLLGDDTDQPELEKFKSAARCGQKCTVVIRNYKKDGSIFFNELTAITDQDSSGKLRRKVWMLRDASDRIKGEQHYFAYKENTAEALWRLDFNPPISLNTPVPEQVNQVFRNGIFTVANDNAAEIYGLESGDDICDQPLEKFMPKSDPNNMKSTNELVRSGYRISNMITHEMDNNNTKRIVLNNISPVIEQDYVLSIWGASQDVTEFLEVQEILEKSQKDLSVQKRELERKNIALQELISQIELEKRENQKQIITNIQQLILPTLKKLKRNKENERHIDDIRMALGSLTSLVDPKVNLLRAHLSPREIEVCNFVKSGMSNKDIASELNIALHTAEKHRRSIRKKLGLTNKKKNLHSYLNSL